LTNFTSIPSLEEFKEKCFKQNIDLSLRERYKGSYAIYYALYVTHFFSIRIVRFLYNKSITPNQITVFSIIISFVSAYFFSLGSNISCLVGAFLLELFYIFDSVDGQLARAKGLSSHGGKYLDIFCNFLVPPVVLFGVGIGVLKTGYTSFVFYSLWLGCYALLILQVIELLQTYLINIHLSDNKETGKSKFVQQEKHSSLSSSRKVYSMLYRSCTMPVIMNIVTVTAISNIFFKRNIFEFTIAYFAIVGTVVWLSKLVYISKGNASPKNNG
jgi:phosphatidylglycerophosphate synthase|tara:strand:+ start:124 stop:936 length:813 start_codon:yes stop_codon:yes gene_type:complete